MSWSLLSYRDFPQNFSPLQRPVATATANSLFQHSSSYALHRTQHITTSHAINLAMLCSCRTMPLRLLVQGLTGLRVTDSAVTRSARHIHQAFPAVSRLLPPPSSPSRAFSTTPAVYFPRKKPPRPSYSPSSPPSSRTEEAVVQTTSSVQSEEAFTLSPVRVSKSILDQAMEEGSALEFTPNALDHISAHVDQDIDQDMAEKLSLDLVEPDNMYPSSLLEDEPISQLQDEPIPKEPIDELGLRFDPELQSTESLLKKRKLAKKDAKEKSNEKGQKDKNGKNKKPHKERWEIQKEALKEKFPEGWQPRKRLSPDACEGIRALHKQYPELYTLPVLASHFKISPEAVRRILRSKWRPDPEEEIERQDRWFSRGKRIWSQMAALGKKPPKKWRQEGIVRDPSWNVKKGPRNYWPYVPHPYEEVAEEPITKKAMIRQNLAENLV
ncbi:hypothetical protein F5X96DRAFT_653383 [Biscogniauxia mediterranea]|nr:hypothetical protein F5X96DRAFT_653383 [Biscogniauxia mediterranea]